MSWIPKPSHEWWLGYSYTINSIIGAGILAIPWAYSNCGWILGVATQFLVLFISLSASYLLLSAWSRVETIAQLIDQGAIINPVPFSKLFINNSNEGLVSYDKSIEIQNKEPTILDRKFDLYEMVKLTMGNWWSKFVILSFIFAASPALVAYIAVFSKSMASNIPLFGYTCNLYDEDQYFGKCRSVYWGYLTIFSTSMIILAFFHISHQRWMQFTLTIYRVLVIFIMLITSLIALCTNSELDGNGTNKSDPVSYNFQKFGSLFFIIIFASMFENLIPTTTGFVKNKSAELPKIINLACISFNILYISVGLVLAFSVENPEEMVSLNWRHYTAGYSIDDRPWWTYIIAYIVILLPAMDIASSFPIISGNFADNLMSITYGHEKIKDLSHVILN